LHAILIAQAILIHCQRLGQVPRKIGVETSHHAHVIHEYQDHRGV